MWDGIGGSVFFVNTIVSKRCYVYSKTPMIQLTPSKADIRKQQQLQDTCPGSVAVLLSLTSSNRPSRFFPEVADPGIGASIVAPIHNIAAFRTIYERVEGASGEGWSVSPEEIVAAVLEQPFTDPDSIRSRHQLLIVSLHFDLNLRIILYISYLWQIRIHFKNLWNCIKPLK